MSLENVLCISLVIFTIIFIIIVISYSKGYEAGERKMREIYLIKEPLPCEYRLTPLQTPYYNLERLAWNDEYFTDYKVIAEGVTEEEAKEVIENLSRPVIEIGEDND